MKKLELKNLLNYIQNTKLYGFQWLILIVKQYCFMNGIIFYK